MSVNLFPIYKRFFPPRYYKGDCVVCREPIRGKKKPAVAHQGDGTMHPIHRQCAKDAAWISAMCPTCRIQIDSSSLFTWKDICNHEFKCLSQQAIKGALHGTVVGGLLVVAALTPMLIGLGTHALLNGTEKSVEAASLVTAGVVSYVAMGVLLGLRYPFEMFVIGMFALSMGRFSPFAGGMVAGIDEGQTDKRAKTLGFVASILAGLAALEFGEHFNTIVATATDHVAIKEAASLATEIGIPGIMVATGAVVSGFVDRRLKRI